MKYLRKYNESKSNNDELADYIDDSLIDIKDLGLGYEVVLFNEKGYTYYNINCDQDLPISRVDIIITLVNSIFRSFDYSDIGGSIDQINSYLSENGFEYDLYSSSFTERTNMSRYGVSMDSISNSNDLINVRISFRKTN